MPKVSTFTGPKIVLCSLSKQNYALLLLDQLFYFYQSLPKDWLLFHNGSSKHMLVNKQVPYLTNLVLLFRKGKHLRIYQLFYIFTE